jgi:hypothetical protein
LKFNIPLRWNCRIWIWIWSLFYCEWLLFGIFFDYGWISNDGLNFGRLFSPLPHLRWLVVEWPGEIDSSYVECLSLSESVEWKWSG